MRTRAAALAVMLVLFAAACGSRVPEDVLEAMDSGAGAGATDRAAAGDVTPGAPADSTSADTGTDAPAGGTGGEASIGGAAAPAGGGGPSSGQAPQGGAAGGTGGEQPVACGAPGNTDTGVTDKEIKIAAIVTDSGPLPGATEGSYRGAASYFAMVNATGGVCGRKITILKGDDGLDPQRARAEFLRLEPKVLAFAGQFSVADSGFIDLLEKTGVPSLGTSVDPAGEDLPNVLPKGVRNAVATGPFVYWKQKNPAVKKAGMLFADVGGVEANVAGPENAIKRAGFDLVYGPTGVGVADPDYTAHIQNLREADVEFVYVFAFEVNMHVRFVRNMRQQNYDPPIKGAIIAFNNRFSELLGKSGDGWENHTDYLPFLDPAERQRSQPLAAFLDWNERVFPGGQLDLFPASGWGAAAYLVDALKRIQGPITRDSLMKALYEVPVYNRGGIGVDSKPTGGQLSKCFVMSSHVDGQWVRAHPASGFECGLGEIYQYG